MEKKKRSQNTAIWVLMAAMLAGVIFISVWTVAMRRRGREELPDAPVTTAKPSETSRRDTPKYPTESEKLPETDAPADSLASDTTAPDETVKPTSSEDTLAVGVLPAQEDDERPISFEARYYVLPVEGTVSKSFEIDVPVWSVTMDDYRAHTGVDISAPLGSEVISASSGIVARVWNDPMMGRSIMLDHGGEVYTTYQNLSTEGELPPVGSKVGVGQVIGAVGESALVEIGEPPHLHLEMRVAGALVDPLDYIVPGSSEAE